MKQINFKFFDGGGEEQWPFVTGSGMERRLKSWIPHINQEDRPTSVTIIGKGEDIKEKANEAKTRIILEAIEKKEGRSPYEGEIEKFGRLERSRDNKQELVMWKGHTLIHFGEPAYDGVSQRVEFKYKMFV